MAIERSNSMTKESAPAYEDGEHATAPPAYSSLPELVAAEMNSLAIGDPEETISVPMILSTEQKRKRDLFLPSSKAPVVTQTVIVRKMKREHYVKHYAKDAEGNYVGTEKPAADAGLVFVMGKSSSEDILEQIRKVAFNRQHHSADFGHNGAAAWGGGDGGGGGGSC